MSRHDDIIATTEVLIIGAGVSGLTAARDLHKLDYDVIVLEARNRLGGRVHSDNTTFLPGSNGGGDDSGITTTIDLGAAWIHGRDDNPLSNIARQCSAKTFHTDDDDVIMYHGSGERMHDGEMGRAEKEFGRLLKTAAKFADTKDRDISLHKALASSAGVETFQTPLVQFQLSSYLEFDFGAPAKQLSAWYYDDDKQFRGVDVLLPDRGYIQLLECISQGIRIDRQAAVESIEYGKRSDGVILRTNRGIYKAKFVICTLPIGVLQAGDVSFQPPLPASKVQALHRLGSGLVNKVVLQFHTCFWPADTQYFGICHATPSKYSYFLNAKLFTGQNILLTVVLGNDARVVESQSDKDIRDEVMSILRRVFDANAPEPTRMLVTRWGQEKYSRGSYSYNKVGATRKDFKMAGQPVEGVLFFAGEHTCAEYRGSVHGAYLSGIRAAKEVWDHDKD